MQLDFARADLVDIRAMLAAYMKRLADKDAAAGVTKEWQSGRPMSSSRKTRSYG